MHGENSTLVSGQTCGLSKEVVSHQRCLTKEYTCIILLHLQQNVCDMETHSIYIEKRILSQYFHM